MPETNTDNRVRGSTGASGSNASGLTIKTFADFKENPELTQVAMGTRVIKRGDKDQGTSKSIQMVQIALFSLADPQTLQPFLEKRGGLDGSFGPGTEASVAAFQRAYGEAYDLIPSGQLDQKTLRALDRVMAKHVTKVKTDRISKSSDFKAQHYKIVADISSPNFNRLYVIDTNIAARDPNDPMRIVARYQISPGTSAHPTVGPFGGKKYFLVSNLRTMQPWNPPNSDWARGLKPIAGGVNNPMGPAKAQLDSTAQYLHGIPFTEYVKLGRWASHGCIRMSGTNILHLMENYIDVGSKVYMNRDPRESAKLNEALMAQGLPKDIEHNAGREFLAPYVFKETARTYSTPPRETPLPQGPDPQRVSSNDVDEERRSWVG
jgi:peptidoglycan hydrolase-like protein with peptidoglycan-binding domain